MTLASSHEEVTLGSRAGILFLACVLIVKNTLVSFSLGVEKYFGLSTLPSLVLSGSCSVRPTFLQSVCISCQDVILTLGLHGGALQVKI